MNMVIGIDIVMTDTCAGIWETDRVYLTLMDKRRETRRYTAASTCNPLYL